MANFRRIAVEEYFINNVHQSLLRWIDAHLPNAWNVYHHVPIKDSDGKHGYIDVVLTHKEHGLIFIDAYNLDTVVLSDEGEIIPDGDNEHPLKILDEHLSSLIDETGYEFGALSWIMNEGDIVSVRLRNDYIDDSGKIIIGKDMSESILSEYAITSWDGESIVSLDSDMAGDTADNDMSVATPLKAWTRRKNERKNMEYSVEHPKELIEPDQISSIEPQKKKSKAALIVAALAIITTGMLYVYTQTGNTIQEVAVHHHMSREDKIISEAIKKKDNKDDRSNKDKPAVKFAKGKKINNDVGQGYLSLYSNSAISMPANVIKSLYQCEAVSGHKYKSGYIYVANCGNVIKNITPPFKGTEFHYDRDKIYVINNHSVYITKR